ncbi:hypothetical protein ER308_03570 [Egibacter rhizosphaerae]|uniref:Uncharacterized protein n=1 Tax=Egibacter rhizosphaerae TaxID=1670831 RepID=A0A411YBW3_9ACTN|nr:hypothetical protein [Egibacter rhizosphaerae]QBI18721.1 hypothetical protein ER308_03570 [Egibacter rhizosphaerae]
MSEVLYRPQVRIVRDRGPNRRAELPVGESVRFGVHNEIAAHYGASVDADDETSTTIDYVVAAAAG